MTQSTSRASAIVPGFRHDCKSLCTFTPPHCVCIPGFNNLYKSVRKPIFSSPNLSTAARSHVELSILLPITSHLYQDWPIPIPSSGIHSSSTLSTQAQIHCDVSSAHYSVARVDQSTDICLSEALLRPPLQPACITSQYIVSGHYHTVSSRASLQAPCGNLMIPQKAAGLCG